MSENIKESWSSRKSLIIDDIDVRVESLKSDLDKFREDMLTELDEEDSQM